MVDPTLTKRQDAQLAMEALQLRSLSDRLMDANRRIAELEQSERMLSVENGRLRTTLNQNHDDLLVKNTDAQLWPSEQIDMAVRRQNIVQRRDVWLGVLQRTGTGNGIYGIYPHDGGIDPITILVRGSGGFGDMIYLSIVVRRLYERFNAPRIVVLHEHPLAAWVLESNPYILDVLSLQGSQHNDFLRAAASLDVFDLIADVRYVVSYSVPPLSRIPKDFLIAAHTRSVEWQRYVRRDWPFHNNILSRECQRLGMSKYDLVGYTANLPMDSSLAGDFYPLEELTPDIADQLVQPYITLHHGADKNMSSASGLQTKNLPNATWGQICEQLSAAGFVTVQLGEKHEGLIEGVDVDLRGQTSFAASAIVLKHAMVHVDTEGGLVHLARSMGTPSVVAFGPTPVSFFGYKANVNLEPSLCGDCWWTTREWARSCPRGLANPECMESHSAKTIARAALDLASVSKSLEYSQPKALAADTPDDAVAALAAMVSERHDRTDKGAFITISPAIVSVLKDAELSEKFECTYFLPSTYFHDAVEQGELARVRPYVPQHIPADSDAFDWVIIEVGNWTARNYSRMFVEAARLVGDGGAIYCYIAPGVEIDIVSQLFVEAVSAASNKISLNLTLPGDADMPLAQSSASTPMPSANGACVIVTKVITGVHDPLQKGKPAFPVATKAIEKLNSVRLTG